MSKSISEIVKQRKKFVSNAYNFLNQHQDILDELKISIMEEISDDLQIEAETRKKWIEQTNNLDKFNQEMKTLRQNSGDNPIPKEKILEMNYLRNYYEQQIENSKKHYSIALSNLSRKKKAWRISSAEYMQRTINKNTDYRNHKDDIDKDLLILKEYTDNWNKDTINSLKKLIEESNKIIDFSEELLTDISLAKSTESVDMTSRSSMVNQISAQKNSIVTRKCEELSTMLQNFAQSHNFEALSKKLNISFFSMKDFLLDSIYDSTGSGMRASIRIIKRMSQTENKIKELLKRLKDFKSMFEPQYKSLKDKKDKMDNTCVKAETLEESTIYRWIDVNFANIFKPIDEKIKRLNEEK